ncbi:hypothetical protein C8F01DRAFT_1002863 [Mycena amicta]|nr:hypothetical protein C8F01DRAFT_1002863 [Mycena amicta]
MPSIRPATISELAAAAKNDPDTAGSSNQPLKYYLRRAEMHKRSGKALATGAGQGPTEANPLGSHDMGLDLERSFIQLAKAATLIADTIPNHRDYRSELSEEKRSNLSLVSSSVMCLIEFHRLIHRD